MATDTTPQRDGLKKLAFLIGKWDTRGTITKDASILIKGTDTYEWISGNCFILHRVDVLMGDEGTEVTEIIGYDQGRGQYFLTSYDNTGAVVTMQATLDDSGVLKLGNDQMRATLHRGDDGNLNAKWELFEDTWQPWMEIVLVR
ncbi:MAG TPA: DUF1579 family protein [Ohtaekwangia sp.]